MKEVHTISADILNTFPAVDEAEVEKLLRNLEF